MLEMRELSQTFWSKDKENVGNGTPAGSVRKETQVVSSTMKIRVQSLQHSQLFLQNLRRRKMEKIQRKQKVLEAEARLGKYLACPARIILQVHGRIHLVKSGIIQNACFTSQRRDTNSEKSALFAQSRG